MFRVRLHVPIRADFSLASSLLEMRARFRKHLRTLIGFTLFIIQMASMTRSTPSGGLFIAFTSVMSFLFRAFKLFSAAINIGRASPVANGVSIESIHGPARMSRLTNKHAVRCTRLQMLALIDSTVTCARARNNRRKNRQSFCPFLFRKSEPRALQEASMSSRLPFPR